jgi:carbon-monoxide dehydrogenase medium subunit
MELIEPGSLLEACEVLADSEEHGLDGRAIAGGTALMLLSRYGFFRPDRLISLQRLDGKLKQIAILDDGSLRIGAMVTLTEMLRHPHVAEISALHQALAGLANPRVRNAATLAGHLAHADPHMDLPPVLLALGAVVHTTRASGQARRLAVDELILGYYETALEVDELITHVDIPGAAAEGTSTYLKFTALAEEDWPTVGVAVVRGADESAFRVAVGAITDRPVRLRAVEAVLAGDPGRISEAAAQSAGGLTPLDDGHGSAVYKTAVLEVQVRRALEQAARSGRS